jgi:hypothetical protein
MTMRIEWADIADAARKTSEELAGKDWVTAGIKARVLLADLADEIDRLRAVERERDVHKTLLVDVGWNLCKLNLDTARLMLGDTTICPDIRRIEAATGHRFDY